MQAVTSSTDTSKSHETFRLGRVWWAICTQGVGIAERVSLKYTELGKIIYGDEQSTVSYFL
jgi:hypothetical protein